MDRSQRGREEPLCGNEGYPKGAVPFPERESEDVWSRDVAEEFSGEESRPLPITPQIIIRISK